MASGSPPSALAFKLRNLSVSGCTFAKNMTGEGKSVMMNRRRRLEKKGLRVGARICATRSEEGANVGY